MVSIHKIMFSFSATADGKVQSGNSFWSGFHRMRICHPRSDPWFIQPRSVAPTAFEAWRSSAPFDGSNSHKSAQGCLELISGSHKQHFWGVWGFWVYCSLNKSCPASAVYGLALLKLHPVGSLCSSAWNLTDTTEYHSKMGLPWRSLNLVVPKPLKDL